jgi:AhpD family alkylhydroperoxidase
MRAAVTWADEPTRKVHLRASVAQSLTLLCKPCLPLHTQAALERHASAGIAMLGEYVNA